MRVLNETADYYCYFDATPHAEFLFGCVRKTIEEDLPEETDFLRRFNRFAAKVERIADMPHRTSICFSIFSTRTMASCRSVHAQAVSALPPHHADPFDRLLIAQAGIEKMTLLTVDGQFVRYGINMI